MCNFQKNRKYDEYLRFILNRWREIKQTPPRTLAPHKTEVIYENHCR